MLQTADYARAVLSTRPHTSANEVEELVTARLARQALLARADPPLLYVLLDEGVLHRPVATPEIMAVQLARLAELSEQTYVTLQVVLYSAGAHIGLQGGFAIADLPDLPGIVFLDSVADGQTVEDAGIVSQVTQCLTAIASSVISYRTRYRPTLRRRRSGDPYGNNPVGRGSSASQSIASNTARMPCGSSRNAAAWLIARSS